MSVVPAADLSLAEQAGIVNRAFAGYVAGWAQLDASGLARFLLLQGADLFYSRFVEYEGRCRGFGYINRTGNISRLAGMALEPEVRGTGAGAHLLEHLCRESRERGERAMMLEVIEQNPRAHAFYRRHGFRELGRLLGWRRAGDRCLDGMESDVEEVSVPDALKFASANDYPELPWQITRYAIAKVSASRAFRFGNAIVVVSAADETSPIRVHGFLSASGEWKARRDALAHTMRRFPNREFFTPAVFPEEFGAEIFAPLGFTREPLSQFLMRRDF